MNIKSTRILLLLVSSIVLTSQIEAEIDPWANKATNAILAVCSWGASAFFFKAGMDEFRKYGKYSFLNCIADGSCVGTSLLASYITYKTYFEKQPHYQTCPTTTGSHN